MAPSFIVAEKVFKVLFSHHEADGKVKAEQVKRKWILVSEGPVNPCGLCLWLNRFYIVDMLADVARS